MMTMEMMKEYPEITVAGIEEALKKAIELIEKGAESFYASFPKASSVNNFYEKGDNTDWTEGFWTGELWLAYEKTGHERLKEAALEHTQLLLERIINRVNTDHHDMGFLYTPSCVAAYKLTGSETGKRAALLAADNLMRRFCEKGSFFQAWGKIGDKDNYRLIIDCLMNMPLLFWASKVTGRDEYADKARRHIVTAMENIVRRDNSTYHTYFFDPDTGLPLKGVTCQGNRNGSAWARGQAWGIYGSAVAYSKLKNSEYIDIFRRVTDYFLMHLPEDLIPYWDFDFDTGSSEPRDSSAAAIAVCGMLEMAKYLQKDEAELYISAAKRLMYALTEKCVVKSEKESNGLLLHGTYARKTPTNTCGNCGVDECCAWGDYFYAEALMRLSGDWQMYW